jgi:hypothetical protein
MDPRGVLEGVYNAAALDIAGLTVRAKAFTFSPSKIH